MDIRVSFPGNKRVDAAFGAHVVHTDQSKEHGGEGASPEPYELFLASLATCAGIYVLGFCQARNLPTDGIELVQRHEFEEEKHTLKRVSLEVRLPESFPEKYRVAVLRAAENCRVKKTLFAPPEVVVTASYF
jgi:ribosomal protein S12 methylthiotransferase accessory factor